MSLCLQTETRFFDLGLPERPFQLHNGTNLPEAQLAYETYGELNPEASNAVLVFHALSGSQHAAGYTESVAGVGSLWTDECRVGWWDGFIGPGRAIDTDHFFVICANYLGGCYGSTGPRSQNPETGRAYGSQFPAIDFVDILDSQMCLLDFLGIRTLHAAIGASLGGLLALSLAARYPDRVRKMVPFAAGAYVTPLQRIHNFEQIFAIESDPTFMAGDYALDHPPERGLAVARMIGHKTYVSLEAMQERARDELVKPSDDLSWYHLTSSLESYVLHQGKKFVDRFDANTYLRILDAWQRFDLLKGTTAPDLVALFSICRKQKYLIFTIDSDVCFYPEEQATLVQILKEAGVSVTRITVHSEKGHDSFLLEPKLYQPYLRMLLME